MYSKRYYLICGLMKLQAEEHILSLICGDSI